MGVGVKWRIGGLCVMLRSKIVLLLDRTKPAGIFRFNGSWNVYELSCDGDCFIMYKGYGRRGRNKKQIIYCARE